jgi:hypothetical protein
MSTPIPTQWQHLERRPDSPYRQLFVPGHNLAAYRLYRETRDPEHPAAPENLANLYDVPLAAVREAIAYGKTNPPEVAADRALDDARIQVRLYQAFHATIAAEPTGYPWQYLGRKPGSSYKQLFVLEKHVRARSLYGHYGHEYGAWTIDEIAADRDLPIDAVLEALAYVSSDPPELREDWEKEERLAQALGMNDPDYKLHGKPKQLSPQEWPR